MLPGVLISNQWRVCASQSNIIQCTNQPGLTQIPTNIPTDTKSLQLIRNGITSIDTTSFSGLSSLVEINLIGNDISSIESGAFVDLPSLESVLLRDNPLICCTMIDFIELAQNQTRVYVAGTCHDFNITININSFNSTRCSVDGQWGSWSSSPCSVSCGDGIGNRQRICDSPKPSVNGKDCVGTSVETMICNLGECEVDGQWGSWSTTPCSVSCGDGIGNRQRSCDSPKPSVNGKDCFGPSMETMICNLGECSVDSQWSSWSTTPCSVSCGDGIGKDKESVTAQSPLSMEKIVLDLVWKQ
ncbi:unnamed protein product [Mytilus edulis]|uniref:Uncharacterized protein n=1 Tax=Mytilus edulis TaxID=6550 RepID=A0A8S3QRT9_MYTED|nr:unnamed protein product [Mytilus edulis]